MKDTAYYKSLREAGAGVWGRMKWNSLIQLLIQFWSAELCAGVHLPNKLGLGNLHDSLYVEYWGWEYGLPEKSPPERKHRTRNRVCLETAEDGGDDLLLSPTHSGMSVISVPTVLPHEEEPSLASDCLNVPLKYLASPSDHQQWMTRSTRDRERPDLHLEFSGIIIIFCFTD